MTCARDGDHVSFDALTQREPEEIIEYLFKRDENGNSILGIAVEANKPDFVEFLYFNYDELITSEIINTPFEKDLESFPKITSRFKKGETMLFFAIKHRYVEVARWLLEFEEIDPNDFVKGFSLLHYAFELSAVKCEEKEAENDIKADAVLLGLC